MWSKSRSFVNFLLLPCIFFATVAIFATKVWSSRCVRWNPPDAQSRWQRHLKWFGPPDLLTAHQSDKVIDLLVQFVKYIVSRREDPRLMKASRALVKSLNFYQVSFSLPLAILTEVWYVPWDPRDEQSPSQKGIDVIVSAASQAYQFAASAVAPGWRGKYHNVPNLYDLRSAKEVYKLESISRIRFTPSLRGSEILPGHFLTTKVRCFFGGPSRGTKSKTRTLAWSCLPNLLVAHFAGKLTSLNFEVVNTVVSRSVEVLDYVRMKRILSSWVWSEYRQFFMKTILEYTENI